MGAETFGGWLLRQGHRDGWIGDLAKQAMRDPAFPGAGDPETVRVRLGQLGADGDAFEALDDAEREWSTH